MANELKIEYLPVGSLKPYEKNAKKHPTEQIEHIANSIREFGFRQPLVIDKENVLVIGHGRLLAAKKLGLDTVPCVRADDLTDEQIKALRLADNKLNESEWDAGLLNIELDDITDIDMGLFGFEKTVAEKEEEAKQTLAEAFIVPPLSILDVKQPYWQERKKAWKTLIGDNGQARGGGQALLSSRRDFLNKIHGKEIDHSSSSVLDPVLCEVLLTWFCPTTDNVSTFDCFAGDTSFGLVSSYLGHNFTGIELREQQVKFNQNQCKKYDLEPRYICDDGRNVLNHIAPASQDFFFSCPPYFDMEVYSDKPNDASNQKSYEEFYKIIDEAFTNAAKCLKKNRFAAVVVQDIRNAKGGYYGFIEDIIDTFVNAGFSLYNRIILLRANTTASLFARKSMNATRKVRNLHEDVLVFYNGEQNDFATDLPAEDVVDAFYAEFLKARQNVPAYNDVLVFFNGNTTKEDFKPLGGAKDEGKDME